MFLVLLEICTIILVARIFGALWRDADLIVAGALVVDHVEVAAQRLALSALCLDFDVGRRVVLPSLRLQAFAIELAVFLLLVSLVAALAVRTVVVALVAAFLPFALLLLRVHASQRAALDHLSLVQEEIDIFVFV